MITWPLQFVSCRREDLARLETRTEEFRDATSRMEIKSNGRQRNRRREAIPHPVLSRMEIQSWRGDPKGDDLTGGGAKPEETPVEARSGADVQIARRTHG